MGQQLSCLYSEVVLRAVAQLALQAVTLALQALAGQQLAALQSEQSPKRSWVEV
jgi:hypothetical protein